MQSNDSPEKISVAFAQNGDKQPIPIASQIGIADGRASFSDGFPPITRIDVLAGGVPPFGTDFNGILNAITTILKWHDAGGHPKYDATFSAEIGGYPKGAVLQKANETGFWVSTTENNTSNPDTGGSGWVDNVGSALTAFLPKRTFSENDYIRIPDVPGGLIIQWGTVLTDATGQVTFSLPTSFPSSGFALLGMRNSTGAYESCGGYFPSKSSGYLKSSALNNTLYYLAIGY